MSRRSMPESREPLLPKDPQVRKLIQQTMRDEAILALQRQSAKLTGDLLAKVAEVERLRLAAVWGRRALDAAAVLIEAVGSPQGEAIREIKDGAAFLRGYVALWLAHTAYADLVRAHEAMLLQTVLPTRPEEPVRAQTESVPLAADVGDPDPRQRDPAGGGHAGDRDAPA